MKKMLLIILSLLLSFSITNNIVKAENNNSIQGLDECLNNLWLTSSESEEFVEKMRNAHQAKIEASLRQYLNAPGYAREKIGLPTNDDELIEYVINKNTFERENTFKIYYLKENVFSKQYAENNCLNYLISDSYYWIMVYDLENGYNKFFNPDGSITKNIDLHVEGLYTIKKGGFDFISDKEKIKEFLSDANITQVDDLKIISVNDVCTCLYVKSQETEYLSRIYMGRESINHRSYDWVDEFELFKLYEAKEALKIISESADALNETKETYETEAISLQNNGWIYGNENGLDLLKPLTRIEATAILVRILGLEDTQTSESSYFTDITSDNWGAKYANIAYDAGIAAGVGNGEFAPDKKITASQFTTLLLRSQNENPDWQTAINLLVEREILTQEQVDKMDLFTRGDMAKIIYEMRERGII